MFNFLFKSFIGIWLMRMAWKFAVWLINKRYKNRGLSHFINKIDEVVSVQK